MSSARATVWFSSGPRDPYQPRRKSEQASSSRTTDHPHLRRRWSGRVPEPSQKANCAGALLPGTHSPTHTVTEGGGGVIGH
eukprot:275605-Alexandrium_andersonii.AAC.1